METIDDLINSSNKNSLAWPGLIDNRLYNILIFESNSMDLLEEDHFNSKDV